MDKPVVDNTPALSDVLYNGQQYLVGSGVKFMAGSICMTGRGCKRKNFVYCTVNIHHYVVIRFKESPAWQGEHELSEGNISL